MRRLKKTNEKERIMKKKQKAPETPTTMPKMPRLGEQVGEERSMWALRLNNLERGKLAACARQAQVNKTFFIRWLIDKYFEDNVLPEVAAEAQKAGITVPDMLDRIYKTYRCKGEVEEEAPPRRKAKHAPTA